MARSFGGYRYSAASNATPSGVPQGTMGGKILAGTSRPGRPQLMLGDEMYLWMLIGIEVGLTIALRKQFRRHHGG